MIRSARLLLCLAVFSFSLTKSASADTYTDYVAATSSGDVNNLGFTGDGRSLVVSSLTPVCGSYTIPCYGTFTPGAGLIYSATEPILTGGNGPGGYSTFTAVPTDGNPFQDLYVAHDGIDTLIYEGAFGNVLVNSFGDVAFDAYTDFDGILGDSNVLAVNSTPTPEPSAFVLLGTGMLGMITKLRRKPTHGRRP